MYIIKKYRKELTLVAKIQLGTHNNGQYKANAMPTNLLYTLTNKVLHKYFKKFLQE